MNRRSHILLLRASRPLNSRLLFILVVCIFVSPAFSTASGLSIEKEAITKLSGLWDELSGGFEWSLRALTFGAYQDVADSSQNPDNAFFQIPRFGADLELRPDARLNFRRLSVSVKPRGNLEWMAWEDGTRTGDEDWDDDWFINEWLARIKVAQGMFLSYGRENLQWGPSYLISPSNPFFKDNGRSNPKREVPGMDFARLVWLPGAAWTLSLIANMDEGRQEFSGSVAFERSYALKLDYAGQEGYAGLILSRKEGDRNLLGAFAGWTATNALLLYGEGSLSRGTSALYPQAADNPFGASMEAVEDESSSMYGTVLAGGSYTLEAGPTITAEYLYNSPGYSDHQANIFYLLRRRASDAFTLPGPIRDLSRLTLSRTADPGLRFLRRNYGMLQYMQNNIKDVCNLTFRWIRNIDDGSGQFIAIVEYYLGDHIQLFSIGGVNCGNGDTEFGAILDRHCMIGAEYTF
jgi:hypothetical protein